MFEVILVILYIVIIIALVNIGLAVINLIRDLF